MRALALLALLAPAIAQAETKPKPKLPTTPVEVFASGMRIEESAVVETQEFQLTNAGEFRRAIIGRFKSGELVIGGAVLVWCDTKLCWSMRAWLGPAAGADALETLGLVDLAGAPAPFPRYAKTKYERELKLEGKAKPKFPALLVRTTERKATTDGSRYGGTVTGTSTHSELFVLSLSRKDERSPTVLNVPVVNRNATGAGLTVSFAVGKDGVLVATEQWHLENASACIEPKPVTAYYKLDEHRRFRRSTDLEHRGCGSR